MPTNQFSLQEKTQVKNYWILKLLSSDECGFTYLAEDMNTNKEVVLYEFFPSDLVKRHTDTRIKLLSVEDEREFNWRRDSFVNDIKKLIPLKHPSLLKTMRSFEENDTVYGVSEYTKAISLKDYLASKGGCLSERQIQKIILPLIDLLHEMHKQNIIHKNINLKTIYIDKDEKALLGNFGLGVCNRLNNQDSCSFIPIEQCLMEKQLGSASDIYAFGAVLYTLMSGEKPIDAKLRSEEIKRGKSDPLVLMKPSAKYSEALCITINQALQLNSSQRSKSVTQLHGEYKKELSKIDPAEIAKIEKNKERVSALPKSMMRVAIALFIGVIALYVVVEKEKPEGAPDLFEAVERSVAVNEAFETDLYKSRNARESTRLAYAYSQGIGVKKDLKKALEWNLKAAKEGDEYAMVNLGRAYYFGRGTTKDSAEAVKWYKAAAAKSFFGGYYELGWCYLDGVGVQKNMKTSAENFQKAIDLGYNYAYAGLGWLHMREKDYNKALEAYSQVKGKGEAFAAHKIGYLYQKGWGTVQDFDVAMDWYKKSAAKGNASAMNKIGYFYLKGLGSLRKNHYEAFLWYEKAAGKGHRSGLANLGMMYEKGWGVTKNIPIAIEWYQSAAKKGNKFAKKRLKKLGVS